MKARQDHLLPREPVRLRVVRTLSDYAELIALRAVVYVGEQGCPLHEEFDGNDLAGATHIVAHVGAEPVGALRMRWFAGFAKAERAAVHPRYRDRGIGSALMDEALRIASRKGYSMVLGHVEPSLVSYWCRRPETRVREGRPSLVFSDRSYVEIVFEIVPHANALNIDSPALEVLRPEGDWDQPGILDRSAERLTAVAA